jgi:hypothetical protein
MVNITLLLLCAHKGTKLRTVCIRLLVLSLVGKSESDPSSCIHVEIMGSPLAERLRSEVNTLKAQAKSLEDTAIPEGGEDAIRWIKKSHLIAWGRST